MFVDRTIMPDQSTKFFWRTGRCCGKEYCFKGLSSVLRSSRFFGLSQIKIWVSASRTHSVPYRLGGPHIHSSGWFFTVTAWSFFWFLTKITFHQALMKKQRTV